MDPLAVAEAAAARWHLDPTGAEVVSDAATTVIRLPLAGAVVHVARPETTDARVAALQTARARLAERGIPVVDILAAADGATWTRIAGRVVDVERWVEHDGRMTTWPLLEKGAEEAAWRDAFAAATNG